MKWKRTAAALLCCAAIVLCAGCKISLNFGSDDSGENNWFDFDDESSGSHFPTGNGYSTNSFDVSDTTEQYDYSSKSTLNDKRRDLYNRIIALLDAGETVFDFDDIDNNEDFKEAYYAVLNDHPEYFWICQNYAYTVRTYGDEVDFHVEPTLFSDNEEEIRTAARKLEERVDEIASGARQQDGYYEMVKYVHDEIIDSTTYDSETLSKVMSGMADGLVNASTAYGCLVEHKAICSGYSSAFQLIMKELDIECGKVNGTRISEAGSHQWNFLLLDGEYYYIDVTWDDPVREDGREVRTYEYFLINDDDLARTHSSDKEFPEPECTGTMYNYYRYNGLYFDEYSFDSIEEAALRFEPDSSLSVKFASPEILEEAAYDLIDNQRIFQMDFINSEISYSRSASGCILNISY